MSRSKTGRSNNVYILGAGFSKAAGMPLLNDFVLRMRDVFELDGRISDAAYIALKMVFEEKASLSQVREKIRVDLDNIEQLFGLIDAADPLSTSLLTDKAKAIRKGISATLLASRQTARRIRCQLNREEAQKLLEDGHYVNELSQALSSRSGGGVHVDLDPYDLYCRFIAKKFDPPYAADNWQEDTVITLNYDTVLEDYISSINIEPDYGLLGPWEPDRIPHPGSLRILKLHGSINWRINGDNRVEIVEPEDLISNEDDYPIVVPPTWNKGLLPNELQYVWFRAINALSNASRVFIIGYSMPETDEFFKHFIAAGLLRNQCLRSLVIIDPKHENIKPRLESFLDMTYFRTRLKYNPGIGRKGNFGSFMAHLRNAAHLLDRGHLYF